jgi:hypothetical protein
MGLERASHWTATVRGPAVLGRSTRWGLGWGLARKSQSGVV